MRTLPSYAYSTYLFRTIRVPESLSVEGYDAIDESSHGSTSVARTAAASVIGAPATVIQVVTLLLVLLVLSGADTRGSVDELGMGFGLQAVAIVDGIQSLIAASGTYIPLHLLRAHTQHNGFRCGEGMKHSGQHVCVDSSS